MYKFALPDGTTVCMRERKFLIDRGTVLSCTLDVYCKKIDTYESKKGLEYKIRRPFVEGTNSHASNFDDAHYDWGEHQFRFKLYYTRVKAAPAAAPAKKKPVDQDDSD